MAKLPESTRLRLPLSESVEVQIMGPGFLDVVHARDISFNSPPIQIIIRS